MAVARLICDKALTLNQAWSKYFYRVFSNRVLFQHATNANPAEL